MTDQAANFKKVTVSIGYDAAATSIVLASGHGARLPDPSGDNYNMPWWDSTNYPDPADYDPNVEIVRVTAKTGDTITVVRAQEGTVATTKNTNGATYKMVLGVTAKTITDLQAEITAKGVPSGAITMWHGLISAIPSGWVLCDGTNSTPDLREKFVRGAPASTEAGGTGGADTHTLSVAEMPIHDHDMSMSHVAGSSSRFYEGGTFNNTDNTQTAGSGAAHNNMPAYYQILFIMKS